MAPLRRFVGQHQDRIADPDFCVRDLALRRVQLQQFDGAERALVKRDRAGTVVQRSS